MIKKNNLEEQVELLTRRYAGASLDALVAVLCPLLVPIRTLSREVFKKPGGKHYRASFTVELTESNQVALQRGRTGKFVPASYVEGQTGNWRELAKGRIVLVDIASGIAKGEVYVGGAQKTLEAALNQLEQVDYLEIDQYGAAAKVLSGLAEYHLVQMAKDAGYTVHRMPEDMARHLGEYANFDFTFERDGIETKVEVKSIWGTNTERARLIHSTTKRPKGPRVKWTQQQRRNYYATSSCKFATQDVFAVSLFLRTGNIRDFAFARSVPADGRPYGLPWVTKHPEHVSQNPKCEIGDGVWFATIDEVMNLG